MRHASTLFLFGSALLCWLGPAPLSGAGDQPRRKSSVEAALERVDVSISTSSKQFDLFEKVVLHCTAVNNSAIPLFQDEDWFTYKFIFIYVIDDNGDPLPKTRYFSEQGGREFGTTAIFPGKTAKIDLIANLVNDMTLPGEYTLKVRVPFRNGDRPIYKESNSIKVIINRLEED